MKDGRAVILISRSIKNKGLQESTEEKILQHLLNIARSEPKEGQATEKRAEELIEIIESDKSEEEILQIVEQMEKELARSLK